ncbi:hypothetical protein ACLGJF_19525, partial [Acinetobacter baumannii]
WARIGQSSAGSGYSYARAHARRIPCAGTFDLVPRTLDDQRAWLLARSGALNGAVMPEPAGVERGSLRLLDAEAEPAFAELREQATT